MEDIISRILIKESEAEKVISRARIEAAEIENEAEKKSSIELKKAKEIFRQDFNQYVDKLQHEQEERLLQDLEQKGSALSSQFDQLLAKTENLVDELVQETLEVQLY